MKESKFPPSAGHDDEGNSDGLCFARLSSQKSVGNAKRAIFLIPNRFEKLGKTSKILILAGISVLLAMKTVAFFENKMAAYFQYSSPGVIDKVAKIQSVVFIDIAVCIAISLAVVFCVSIFGGGAKSPGSSVRVLNRKPYLVFPVYFSLFYIILVGAPVLLGNIFLEFSWKPKLFADIFSVHPLYKKEAFLTALCVSISLTDIGIRNNFPRFWSYVFLLPPFANFPLLWWNALSWIFPARYWSIWKPPLLVLTCLPPLLVFPFAQPIRNDINSELDMPVSTDSKYQRLPVSYAYDAGYSNNFLYVVYDHGDALAKFQRGPSGKWALLKNTAETHFANHDVQYVESSPFDPAGNRVFRLNASHRRIEIVDLDNLQIRDAIILDKLGIEEKSKYVMMAFDPINQSLFINDLNGVLVKIDVASKSVAKVAKIKRGIDVEYFSWKLVIDGRGEHLYQMTANALLVYDCSSLDLVGAVKFSADAGDIVIDELRQRILISFPEKSRVLFLDKKQLNPVKNIRSSMGVRTLAIDEKSDLLLTGSFTGILEIVDLKTMEMKNRFRIGSWIHGLKCNSEFKEVTATVANTRPFVVDYDSRGMKKNIFNVALLLIDEVFFRAFAKEGLVVESLAE